MNTTIGEIR